METMRMEEVWERTRGEGITVAVVDTGTDASLPTLEGRVLEGVDLTHGAEGAHVDRDGHGTIMASLIAGSGAESGIPGLAPGVKILPIRVSSVEYDFDLENRLALAIEYAAESGAQIISASLSKDELGVSPELDAALAVAARHGTLIFASAGNTGDAENTVVIPSAREGVIGVGAVDRSGEHVYYSTYGPQVALSGPGNEIPGSCPDGHYQPACIMEEGGTSSATALASASAALIWSAHPDWTKNQVLRAMLETADGPEGGRDDYVGYGMVRPDRVILDGEGEPGEPDVNPLFEEYEASLDPPVSPAPEPEPETGSEGEGSGESGEAGSGGPDEAAENMADGDGGGSGPLVMAGVVGVVILGGVAAAVVVNRRRRTA
ncbi:S8 family serine peptidase [Streptomyces johnsoniae]|uniref:S8 family serine peptidase n=1 Tax=Streptomyces johnsoniae TaxID=3075532 RepID=A0ABU2RX16_9ACTN|nr:S8 family serine peptidase [Streptomyces sp. DSM 41886]MDT0441001.1 S8 family serine peptidase [Streptomyces sp. DSM 41886]